MSAGELIAAAGLVVTLLAGLLSLIRRVDRIASLLTYHVREGERREILLKAWRAEVDRDRGKWRSVLNFVLRKWKNGSENRT